MLQPNGGKALATVPSHSIADFSQMSLTGASRHGPQPSPRQQQQQRPHVPVSPNAAHGVAMDDGGLDASFGDGEADDVVDPAMMNHRSKAQLQEGNSQLREKLAGLSARLAQLQRFERDLDSIREQHDILQESTDKRERLEQAFRTKLEDRCRRLERVNKQLKAKLEDQRRQTDSSLTHVRDEMMEELARRDRTIHTLTAQCTTGQDETDRIRRQVVQLSDKAQLIPRLESRVSENEARLTRVQDEFARQKFQGARVQDFEAALHDLREISGKQADLEQQQREKLENEVLLLKSQLQKAKLVNLPADLSPLDPVTGSVTSQQICDFEALLCRREARIQQLQEDMVKWRQLYSEELNVVASAESNAYPMRTRSLADITDDRSPEQAMETTSADLFAANRRVVELESAVKQLRFVMSELSIDVANARKSDVGRSPLIIVSDGNGGDESPGLSSSSSPLSPTSKSATLFGSPERL